MLTKSITSIHCTQSFCLHDRMCDNWIEDQENWKNCLLIIILSKNKSAEVTIPTENDYIKEKKHKIVLVGIFCCNQIFTHQHLQHWLCEHERIECKRASSRTRKIKLRNSFEEASRETRDVACTNGFMNLYLSNWLSKLQSRRTSIKESLAMGNALWKYENFIESAELRNRRDNISREFTSCLLHW